jgi:uncharacterized protein involved in type VI secretion and phage assembly
LVVDSIDPSGQDRLLVVVPEVKVEPGWARPSGAPSSGPVPAVGEEVVILFEGGDTDYPVWQGSVPSVSSGPAAGRFAGVYGATVIDNVDPMQTGRLQVSVPDALGYEPVWATPSPSWGPGSALPEIGDRISVQFEGGDENHPVWMGLA